MKLVNPKNRTLTKKVLIRANNCYCYVMKMTAQFYLPAYSPK